MARSNLRIGPGGRGPNDPWFTIGTFEVGTCAFVAILAASSVLLWGLSPQAVVDMAMVPSQVKRGQLWRVASWPLANVRPDIFMVLGIFLVYWFGREVERLVGRVRMAQFLAALIVVGSAVGLALNTPVYGVRLLELALLVSFAIEFPNLRFFFGIPSRIVALVVVGLEVINYMGGRQWAGLGVLLAVLVAALVLLRSLGLAVDLPWIPRVPLPGAKSTRTGRAPRPTNIRKPRKSRSTRKRSGLRVVDAPSKAGPPRGVAQDIDSLLDKISKHGIESLSAEERRALEQTSTRLRNEKKPS